jgi:ABC-type Fe3+-hydroxamate transport system substrate-binding protein
MPSYTDQLGRTIDCPENPRRIISLVPSQTELLFDLGLEAEVAGITKFCVHPDSWHRTKMRVGGTKKIDMRRIEKISPDLIIANKEENNQDEIESLAQRFPVWISDIKTLDDALVMIRTIGKMIGKTPESEKMVHEIRTGFETLINDIIHSKKKEAIYLIWRNPFMLAGSDTFIHDMMNKCGLVNALPHLKRYPQITQEEMAASGAEFILLSSEPFPFTKQHADELKQQFGVAKILLVDGEMFSWYGSRLLQAPKYFKSLHHQMLQ